MICFKSLLLLAVIGLAVSTQPTLAGAAQEPAAQDTQRAAEPLEGPARMYMYKKKGDDLIWPHDCDFPFVNGKVEFLSDSHDCTSDDDYGFKIENAPSAAFITFTDDSKCRWNEGNWAFKLKTIVQPTHMTEPHELQKAFDVASDNVVVGG